MEGDTENTSIAEYLQPSERVLSVFLPFYATSYRVLRLDPPNGPSRGHLLEMQYQQLASIDLTRRASHPIMALGAVLIILGFLTTGILPISAMLIMVMGGVVIFFGARGKPGYYQLYARDMPRQALRYWRVEIVGSANFIATVRAVIGQMPDF